MPDSGPRPEEAPSPEPIRKPDASISPATVDVRVAELLTGLSRRGGSLMQQLSLQTADRRMTGCATPVLVTAPNQLIQVAIPGITDHASGGNTGRDNSGGESPASGDANCEDVWRNSEGNGNEMRMDEDNDGEDGCTFQTNSSRPKRYRNQKQKLSNSMAQKRYRERKKRAFSDMRQEIDGLMAEVESLRSVKGENERLRQTTGALQDLIKSQQDQIDTLRGRMKPEGHAVLEASAGLREEAPNGMRDVEMVTVQAAQVAIGRGADKNFLGESEASGNTRKTVAIENGDSAERGKCSDGSSTQQLPSSQPLPAGLSAVTSQLLGPMISDSTVSSIQNEWNTHMAAMEQVLAANQLQGLPNGPISEEALQLLSRMVSNLYSLNARLMSARVSQILEANRQNTSRICRIFNGLAGCKSE